MPHTPPQTQSQTWAVVLTVDEPAELTLANVAWHLHSGACEVHLYCDRPDDPVAARLAGLAGVHVTLCDSAHWGDLGPRGKRPGLQMRRQALNANHAQARCGADWLLHIDADEFLLQSRPLAEELPHVAGLGAELYLPVWERVFRSDAPQTDLFDGMFRGSTKALNRFDTAIWGDLAPLTLNGMTGHSAGKCGVPVGQGFRIGVHWSFREGQGGGQGSAQGGGQGSAQGGGQGAGQGKAARAPRFPSSSTRLLHFDGMTPAHWLMKLLRYADHPPDELARLIAPERRAQIDAVLRAGIEQGRSVHDRLKCVDPAAQARLHGLGLLDDPGFDPRPAIAAVLGAPLDLTPAHFDAAWGARQPEIARLLRDGL